LIMSGYRNFIDNASPSGFNTQAFLKKRSRATNQPVESMSMVCLLLLFYLFFWFLFGCLLLLSKCNAFINDHFNY
jgi:hypothetical protein